jgi:hypothetical protein
MARVVNCVRGVPGIVAMVLGGSRALGTHAERSDVDIGLYYRDAEQFDIAALAAAARALDDRHLSDLVTPPGGWGAWVDGGGWLQVDGLHVDVIYRDLRRVERVVADALAGRFETAYHWGYPHSFVSTIYAAEIAGCRPLWDPDGAIARLKAHLHPYPEPLRAAMVSAFGREAEFFVMVARHGLSRCDLAYTAGCCYRVMACLMQVLCTHNRSYLMNEKGAVAQAAALPTTVPDLAARVAAIFGALHPDEASLARALDELARLVADVRELVAPSDWT